MTYEKRIFRDNNVNLLELSSDEKEGFNMPNYIMDIKIKDGLSIISHNHTNGLVILSLKDISVIKLVKSKYNPIYSPNKTSVLVNENLLKN